MKVDTSKGKEAHELLKMLYHMERTGRQAVFR